MNPANDLKAMDEEITVRGGPTFKPTIDLQSSQDKAAADLMRDLLSRGAKVSHHVERSVRGETHQVEVNGVHSASGTTAYEALARAWLLTADAEAWGTHEAELLDLTLQIKELKMEIMSLRYDFEMLAKDAHEVLAESPTWSINMNNLNGRVRIARERHRLF